MCFVGVSMPIHLICVYQWSLHLCPKNEYMAPESLFFSIVLKIIAGIAVVSGVLFPLSDSLRQSIKALNFKDNSAHELLG